MSSKKFSIIGIGEILWDIYEDKKFLGGAPANFAIHCQQLGDTGIIASRVGDDKLGQEVIDTLKNRAQTIDFIQRDSNQKTGTVNVTLDEHGKPHFECTANVAFDYDDISFLQFLIDKYNLKLAALTLGENGCILVDIQEVIHQKGVKINPRDTTGCSDAFAAALIHQYLRQKPLDEIASFSNLLDAYVALFPGAKPEYILSDLSRFEKDYNS